MIVNIDAKSLEWVTYLYLSQDKTGIDEWHALIENPKLNDMHTANQVKFNLPSRLISKVFLFRWIYRGPAFAYASDPDFMSVSKDRRFWQDVIDQYYSKYPKIYDTHMKYIKQVNETGRLTSPLGRQYEFKKYRKGDYSEYSEYEITNYPNQGLGADVMAVARISLASRLRNNKLSSLLISTIHDSLTADCPPSEVEQVSEIMTSVFSDLPKNIERSLGIDWKLPMLGEVSIGPNMKDLVTVDV